MTHYLSQIDLPLRSLDIESNAMFQSDHIYYEVIYPPSPDAKKPQRPKGLTDSHPLMREIVWIVNQVLAWHPEHLKTVDSLTFQRDRLSEMTAGRSDRSRVQESTWGWIKRWLYGMVWVEDGRDYMLLKKWQSARADRWWMLIESMRTGRMIWQELIRVCGELRCYLESGYVASGGDIKGLNGLGGKIDGLLRVGTVGWERVQGK